MATIEVDDELLKKARRITGERTYSGTINKALAEIVRVHGLRKALRELQELKAEGPLIREGYLAEIRPNAGDVLEDKRSAALERRLPRKKSRARGAR